MAVSIGNGRYYKLFPGNSPPKRLLIEDISEPGLLSNAFVQGIVVKVYPIKCSERYGKLCKILLKEDVEKPTRNSPCARIHVFLLGDLADEGSRISEGNRVVLSEVDVECSPGGENQFQLIAWREKSQASIWVISNTGNVRANTMKDTAKSSDGCEEAPKTAENHDCSDDPGEEGDVLYESCEYDFSKATSTNRQGTKHNVFEKRKGKFQLGPRGVTPSTSHVKRSVSDVVVRLDKGEAKTVLKTLHQDEYYSKTRSTTKDNSKAQSRQHSHDSCKNSANTTPASVPNAGVVNVKPSCPPAVSHMPNIAVETAGQSMIMSQKTGPGGTGTLSLSIQSANPDHPSNIQCTHIELTPSGLSTRIWKGDPQAGHARDQSQMSTVPSDLPQLMAPRAGSSSTVENNNVAGSGNGQNNKEHSNLKKGNPPKTPSENSIMPDFEQEEHVFVSARRLSSSSDTNRRSPAKGTERKVGIPHHLRMIDEDLVMSSSVKSLIPDDYTPASSLLASQDSSEKGSAKRGSPLQQVPDPKRLRTSPGPSHRSPSPDQSGNTFSGRVKKRSSRAPEDYTVPPGYTTLGNLQPETTVNVYGVVKSFKPAWKCRGTDMCCVLMLMDPTIAESSSGLEVVSFQSSVTRLPAVHKIGDIVRLHRVKVSQYQGRLQATSTRGFAAIVFDRDTELPVTVEMARNSSSTFTLLQSDKDTVESLKNWSDAHPVLFTPSNFLSVSLINPDSYFDLTCQVLGVALHRTLDCVVLYVTDGTQPKHDLRKCAGEEYNVVQPLCNRSSQDDDVISVFLYGSHAEVAQLLVRKDGYVILHNVHSQVLKPGGSVCSVLDVVKPYLELCVHRGTAFGRGLSVLSPDSLEVKQLRRQQGL